MAHAQVATQPAQPASIAATQTALAQPTGTPTPPSTSTPTPTPTATPLFPGAIASPPANARVTLPIHIEARVGTPGDQILATLRGQDGVELTSGSFTVLEDNDGRGLVLGNLPSASNTLPPTSQLATLELRTPAGELLDRQTLTVLGNDADTQPIQLFWVSGTQLQPTQVRIPRTERPGTATLNELLWGPPSNPPGLTTAIPRPDEVLNSSGRQADWGPRVTLRGLTIENGVATADFSQEMLAYGNDPQRAQLIRAQITATFEQFDTVREVRISIEGTLLEP